MAAQDVPKVDVVEELSPWAVGFRGMWARWVAEAKGRALRYAEATWRRRVADDWRERAYEAEMAGNPLRALYLLRYADRLEEMVA